MRTLNNTPTNLQMCIHLTTHEEISKRDVKKWYSIVRDIGPDNITTCVEKLNPDGEPENVCLIHQIQGDEHRYIIPLTRHILEREAEPVVDAWDTWYEGSWEIETSTEEVQINQIPNYNPMYMEKSDYDDMCEQVAKEMHQTWYKEMSDSGWRYGIKKSAKEKTHPLMKPWEGLPKSSRRIDTNLPRKIINMMNRQGYKFMKK